jgi:hypothetical protein
MEPTHLLSRRWKIFRNILLVFCLLNLGFAFIPDIGTFAIISGSVAVILTIPILIKVFRVKAPKPIPIIILVLALASIGAGYWTFTQIKFNFTIQPSWGGIYMPH